jgi:uncharacterized RDD family membrane protein YckC
MQDTGRTITPEAVSVSVDVAGLGSRLVALAVDSLIQLALLTPVVAILARSDLGDTAGIIAISITLFLVVWAYFPLFESFWRGRTPGKRAMRLRVVRTDGQPAGGAAILVRNLIRFVDVLLFPFLAVIAMLLTPRSQRLGDLAAGTIVVRERKAAAPTVHAAVDRPDLPSVDATGITEREYDVIRSFLLRRPSLQPAIRADLAATLAHSVRGRIGAPPAGLTDELLLEAVASSYRRRFAGGASVT